MIHNQRRQLTPEEISCLSSPYLNGGRAQEAWAFSTLEVNGHQVTAEMAMSCIYISETDPGGFHLSFITAIEMISQLTVVALHSLAGLQSKSREVWARETRGRFVKPIRQQHGMQIEMQIRSLRNHGGVCLCEADYRITDQAGGLFMYWVKCALV